MTLSVHDAYHFQPDTTRALAPASISWRLDTSTLTCGCSLTHSRPGSCWMRLIAPLGLSIFTARGYTGPIQIRTRVRENFALFEAEGRGPLTSNIPEAAGFFRARSGVPAPDVEFHFAPGMLYDGGLTLRSACCFGYSSEVAAHLYENTTRTVIALFDLRGHLSLIHCYPCCSKAATPGSVRPSIHSRNAPPAVETKVKS